MLPLARTDRHAPTEPVTVRFAMPVAKRGGGCGAPRHRSATIDLGIRSYNRQAEFKRVWTRTSSFSPEVQDHHLEPVKMAGTDAFASGRKISCAACTVSTQQWDPRGLNQDIDAITQTTTDPFVRVNVHDILGVVGFGHL